ncbi:MAG: flagellar hook-associated protein FlgL, partial [Candidatus Eisenbacteria sp.]|nr:flagellar hook-associated protein FlgL [Candidatus Eisenbacteria bacterium]
MRIPSNRLQLTMMHALNDTLGRIERVQTQLATGKRIQKPSDDPTGTMRLLSFQRSLDRNRQYQDNVADGLRWATSTEMVMGGVNDILMQVKEIALRGANELPESRFPMGTSVDSMLEELIDQISSQIDNRYLLSGFMSFTSPIQTSTLVENEAITAGAVGVAVDLVNGRIASGTVVVTDQTGTTTFVEGVDYTVDHESGRISLMGGGSMVEGTGYLASYETETVSSVTINSGIEGEISRQIDSNRTVTVNLLASDVMDSSVDIFQMVIDLKNALWKDDGQAVGDLLDTVDGAIDQITGFIGMTGSKAASMENQQVVLESDEL